MPRIFVIEVVKKHSQGECRLNFGGRGWIRTIEANATDLQSAPFGHSGTLPKSIYGAGGRTRTPDLLITNQLLYQLSYTSMLWKQPVHYSRHRIQCQ